MPPVSPLIEALRTHTITGGRYLIAVSGGADSMSLLHSAHVLAREGHMYIEAAHVNHNLREAASGDAEFVHKTCYKLGIELHTSVVTEQAPQTNIESWGRLIRYRFFREVLDARDLSATLTGHSANDVAETLLMRLVTNKELYTIHRSDSTLKVIRPFLGVWRDEIIEFLNAGSIEHVEDSSNGDTRFLRNRVRHELLPFLSDHFDGDLPKILWEQAQSIDEDLGALSALLHPHLERVSRHDSGSKEWLRTLRNALIELPDALKWRLVDRLFRPIAGFGYGRENSRRIADFLLGSAVGMELPGKVTLRRKDGGIQILKTESN